MSKLRESGISKMSNPQPVRHSVSISNLDRIFLHQCRLLFGSRFISRDRIQNVLRMGNRGNTHLSTSSPFRCHLISKYQRQRPLLKTASARHSCIAAHATPIAADRPHLGSRNGIADFPSAAAAPVRALQLFNIILLTPEVMRCEKSASVAKTSSHLWSTQILVDLAGRGEVSRLVVLLLTMRLRRSAGRIFTTTRGVVA